MVENVLNLILTAVIVIVVFILVFVLKTDTLEGIIADILFTDEEVIRKFFRGHTKKWLSTILMFICAIALMMCWVW